MYIQFCEDAMNGEATEDLTVRYMVKELTMNVSKQSEGQSGSWNQKV